MIDPISTAVVGSSLLGGLLGSKTKRTAQEPATVTNTRDYLYNLMKSGMPEGLTAQPVQGITSNDQDYYNRMRQYATSDNANDPGMATMTKIANQSTNPLEHPDIVALMEEMKRQGGQEMGKAWRSLQLGGNTSSSAGAGVLGNLVRDINTGITNTGLQSASGLRKETFDASSEIYRLGQDSTIRKLAAYQSANDAENYLNNIAELSDWNLSQQKANWSNQQAQTYGSMILGSSPQYDTVQTPNVYSQLAGPLSSLAQAFMKPSSGSGTTSSQPKDTSTRVWT
jgi:hypothetical protein